MKFMNRTLFSSPVDYGLCFDKADFIKTLKKMGLPPEEQPVFCASKAGASTHYFPGVSGSRDVIIITLNDTSGYTVNEVNGLLAHEAVHCWQHIKEHIGETCDITAGYEFEAYAIQHIVFNLMTEFEEYEIKQYEKEKKLKADKKAAKKAKRSEE
jgi:hypothetical protein